MKTSVKHSDKRYVSKMEFIQSSPLLHLLCLFCLASDIKSNYNRVHLFVVQLCVIRTVTLVMRIEGFPISMNQMPS